MKAMKAKNKSIIASICLALVALVWGSSYAIIKDTLDIIQPFTIVTIRFVGATIILSTFYFKRLLKIKSDDIKHGGIIGLALFGAFFTLIIGIQLTTVSKQSFLIGSFVIMVPFMRWFINKMKPDIYAIFGAFFALIGLAMLTLGGLDGFNKGDLVSLFCAFFFGLHMITIEKYRENSDPVILTIIQFFVNAILFLALSFIFEDFNFSTVKEAKFSIIYLVLVSTVIAFLVQNIVQKYISSTTTALILTLESAFGSIFAVFYLGEKMSSTMVIACVIIFLGIVTQETKWEFLKNRGNKKYEI